MILTSARISVRIVERGSHAEFLVRSLPIHVEITEAIIVRNDYNR